MKVFRTLDDVERAGLPDALFRAIRDWLRELIDCHEAVGYIKGKRANHVARVGASYLDCPARFLTGAGTHAPG